MEANRFIRRSEEIRRRRTQSAHDPKRIPDHRKRKVVHQQAPPPVLVRTPVYGPAFQGNRSAKNSRIRYDVCLDEQGAEIRLPALPQVRFGWRFASVTVFAFLIFILYQFWNSPTYRVEVADVVGLKLLNSSEINEVLDLPGRQVFSLDTEEIQQDLLDSFGELRAVNVEIDLPNTVVISITERVPILIWRQEDHSLLVDAEGLAYPMRETTTPGGYPVIEAVGDPPLLMYNKPISNTIDIHAEESLTESYILEGSEIKPSPLLSPEMVRAYLRLTKEIPQGARLVYDPKHGIGWIDRREWKVYVGDEMDIDAKLSIYRMMLEHIKAADEQPTLISVEFIHAPYFRLVP